MRVFLKNKIQETKNLINPRLNKLVPEDNNLLTKAIRYSLLSDGKRLRAMLIIETAKLLGVENDDIIKTGCAVEMLHMYTLVHDDLPAMDNDDTRRGQLSSHKKFNEETAILVGDSLLTLSFEVLSDKLKETSFEKRCKIISALSKATGWQGVCLGQSMDLAYEKSGKLKSGEEAEKINKLKTGALFRACVEMGCILGEANKTQKKALVSFSENFGQAFQLRDDLEDGEIDKASIETIKAKIDRLIANCDENLSVFDNNKTEFFRELARFCLNY